MTKYMTSIFISKLHMWVLPFIRELYMWILQYIRELYRKILQYIRKVYRYVLHIYISVKYQLFYDKKFKKLLTNSTVWIVFIVSEINQKNMPFSSWLRIRIQSDPIIPWIFLYRQPCPSPGKSVCTNQLYKCIEVCPAICICQCTS